MTASDLQSQYAKFSLRAGAIHTRHRAGRRPGPWANGLAKCIDIGQWFRFYNKSRPHQALSCKISGGDLGG